MKKRVRKTDDPEILVVRQLRVRTPEEWSEVVEALPNDIRPQVARVIWWDWFANQEVKNRWPHLDKYIRTRSAGELKLQITAQWTREQIADAEFGRDLGKREMTEALIACGYPPVYASKRA